MRVGLIAALASTTFALITAIPIIAATVPAAAQTAPKPGQRVTVTGCPFAGTTASCLMIKGSDGTIYNISGVTPKPRVMDRMIRLRGAVSDKASTCNEGVVLDRIRWTRTRRRCTK